MNFIYGTLEKTSYFVGKGLGHILPKAEFEAGDPEEFRAFLAGRTGLPVTRLR